MFILLLCVAPPLMFTVRDIWPHPWSAYLYHAPPPEYILCRKHDSIEQNFTIISSLLHSTYFPWPNFLSMGIVDISFLSVETGKYATPNGHLNFHFTPLSALFPSASYKLFPWWNQRQLDFFTIKPLVHSNSLLENSIWVTFGEELLSGH